MAAREDDGRKHHIGIKQGEVGRYVLLPGSPETRGHGTTGMAKLYKDQLAELLRQAPRR